MTQIEDMTLGKKNAPKRASYFGKIVVALVALGIVAIFFLPSARDWLTSFIKGRFLSSTQPVGDLYISLEKNGLVHPYQFTFKDGVLARTQDVNGNRLLKASYSPKGNAVAYHCAPNSVQSVCVYNEKENKHIVVSKNGFPAKRDIRWSSDGKRVVYTARIASSTSATDFDPNLWGVFVAKIDGTEEKRIATGTTPFFSPDSSSVLALQRDGLHQKKLETGEDLLVWPMEDGGSANRFMVVRPSPDGTKILWTDTLSSNGGSLALFSIVSWKPFSMKYTNHVSINALQAIFSPDSSSVVFNTQTNENRELYMYDLKGKPKKILDLNSFGPSTYITDWKL